jgi:hypothetical protein
MTMMDYDICTRTGTCQRKDLAHTFRRTGDEDCFSVQFLTHSKEIVSSDV